MEIKGWKRCQREWPIGRDCKNWRVNVNDWGEGEPMRRVGIERYTSLKEKRMGVPKKRDDYEFQIFLKGIKI